MQTQELIAKLTASKGSYAYQKAKLAIEAPGVKIHVNSQSGKGRFTSISNHLSEVLAQLAIAGVTYSPGNDAPRGGRMGDYVIVHNTL